MKKVLIVDDTKNIRTLLTTCLEIEGYEATAVKDGNQALELLAAKHFDLVFLDIKMPEISGTEVLKKMRENGTSTPVIVMTAFATVKNAIDCTNMGAVAYVQKPFSADKIRAVLKEIEDKATPNESEPNVADLIQEAKVFLERQAWASAQEQLKKAISTDLTNPEIYFLLSKCFEGLGDYENSERFYTFYRLYTNK